MSKDFNKGIVIIFSHYSIYENDTLNTLINLVKDDPDTTILKKFSRAKNKEAKFWFLNTRKENRFEFWAIFIDGIAQKGDYLENLEF